MVFKRFHAMLFSAALAALPGYASQIYITSWVSNASQGDVSYANICGNLNVQFPNSDLGAGATCTAGQTSGLAGAQYLYNPATYTSTNAAAGYPQISNGIEFELTSNSSGEDFAQINSGSAYTVNVNQANVTNVYLLMGSYTGQSFSITFNGTGGATQMDTGISLPDFCSVGLGTGTAAEFTIFRVQDVGGCGTGNSSNGYNDPYSLTEVAFTLNSSFSGQTLNSLGITSNGYETLLLGVTLTTGTVASGAPEPAALVLSGLGLAALVVRKWGRRAR